MAGLAVEGRRVSPWLTRDEVQAERKGRAPVGVMAEVTADGLWRSP